MAQDYMDELRRQAAQMGGGVSDGGSDYMATLREQAQSITSANLGATVSQAVDINPDQYARQRKIAERTGVAPAVVEALPKEMAQRDKMAQIQQDAAVSPILQNRYTDADFAKLAHDDSGTLSAVAAVAKYLVSAPGTSNNLMGDIGAGVLRANSGAAGVFRAAAENVAPLFGPLAGTILPENPMLRVADAFRKMGDDTERDAKLLSPPQKGTFANGVSSGVQSLAQNFLSLPMALLPGGQGAALTMMASSQGGGAYNDARDAGVSPQRAALSGVVQGGLEAAFETGPLFQLVKDVKAGTPFFKTLLTNMLLETPNEVATTVLQNADTWATINPNKSAADFLAEQPEAIYQTIIATMIGAGGNTALMQGIQKAADNATGFDRRAAMAEQHAQFLGDMQTTMQASKLLERSPEHLSAYAQELVDQDVPQVFVDSAKLQEAGVDLQQLAQAMPSVAAQLENLQPGGDLVIPTGELLTNSIGATFGQPLIDNARTDVNGMSRVEAKEYMAEKGDKINAEIERVLAERSDDATFKAGRDEVQGQILQQLNDIQRFTPKVNEQYAALASNFYAVMAARTGMTVQDFAARYKLGFDANTAQGNQVLDQPPESLSDPMKLVYRGWSAIASQESAFKYAKSDKTELSDVAKTIDPGFEVSEPITSGDTTTYVLKTKELPDNHASITVQGNEVKLDISKWKQGEAGSRVYAAVANWAHNNGKIFVEDDALTENSIYRRTENMLSSALKFGTTAHIAPGKYLLAGNETLGVAPLQWTPGDHEANIRALIETSYQNVITQLPILAGVRFDFESGQFLREDGTEVTEDRFKQVAGTTNARRARAGVATIKRAIVTHSLVREADSGRGGQVLAQMDGWNANEQTGTSGAFPQGLVEVLYQDPQAPAEEPSDDSNAQISQGDVPTSVDEVAGLGNTLKLAASKVWQKGRDLKLAMQDAVQAAARAAGVDVSAPSPQSRDYLVRVGVKDALLALEQNANAVGWYDLKTRQALAVMALVHPEIATDERTRVAFVWAMAVTSNGLKVGKNFEIAEKVYRAWKASAKEVENRTMPTNVGIGTAAGAINDSLALYNTLSKEWGPEELRKFMLTDFTVGQITGISKDLKPGGEHAATTVKGAAILGPKIGNGFFSNLYGNFSSLTMDRWLVRTWGRWTGTLIKPMPVQTQKAKDRLGAVLANIAKDSAEMARLSKALGVEITPDMSVDALATAVQEASMDPATREVMNQTDTGLELRKAGNSLAKYLDGQKEAPAGPTERNYIREVFNGMLSELRNDPRYSDLTMADLQAVLWYAEKRLYESAKEDPNDDEVEGYSDDEAPDYANAAAEVARQAGITQRRIDNVLKKEAENGRTTDAGSPAAEGDQTGAGEQGPAAGFTRSEKREFIAVRAIHRVRSNRSSNAGQPWSYAGTSGEGRASPRVLKKLGVSFVAEWKLGQKAATVLKANGLKYPKFLELAPGDSNNAQKFADAITASKVASGTVGAAVYLYPTEEYAGMRLFLSEDGQSGVAIKPDGDIVSVFGGGGTGHATMELAVAAGGLKLDAFETILPRFYSAHGFVPVARLTWDDSQAPDGWDKSALARYNNGEPDVVFMALDNQYFGSYSTKAGTRMDGENAYDKALAAQKRAMNKVKKGQTLNQDARGQIAFANDITQQASIISLLKNADLSTFIHESGHFFLEVQADLAWRIAERIARGEEVTDGEKSIMDDFNTTLKWMGVQGDENITPIDSWSMMTADEKRLHHEQFARGFEAYAFEGKAPSLDLQSVFQTFRAWLVNVYRTVKDKLIGDTLNVQLNDEVRAVMDRMLATTSAIEEAEAARSMGPLFKSPQEGGMDLEAYKLYHDMGMQATQDAVQELQAKGLRDMQWLNNARSRKLKELQKQHDALRAQIEREVRAEVMAQPIYQVWAFLTSKTGDQALAGVTDLETADLSTASGKLRTQVLRDMYGTADDATWRKLSELRMTSDENGLHPDLVAESFGFQSADELVQKLTQAEPPKSVIEGRTDQRMLEEHGDLATPAGLERAADAAVHNDARVRFVATELRALQHAMSVREKVPGQKNTVDVLARAAKDHAASVIARLKVRDIRPAQYAAAEARASKAAEKARGDLAKQTEAKRNQLINMAATKAAYAAQDEVKAAVEYFKKFDKVSKSLDPEYQNQIHALLERFDLRQSTSLAAIDKRKSLVEWMADQVEQGMEPDIPPELLQEANRKHFKDMTVEEVRGLRDTIKQIEHLGRLKNKLLTAKEQRDFQAAVAEITGSIVDNSNGRTAEDTRTPNTLPALALQSLKNFWASHIKAATWARVMDGGKDGGKVWEYLIRTANDAGNTETVMKEKATKELAKLVAPVLKQGKMGGKGTYFKEIDRSLNKEAVLAIALNVGNASNLQRLLGGENWTILQLQPVLNSLSAEDWQFVQSVWDHFESYRPMIAAKEMRVYGKEPEWIEAVPVQTRFGVLRGGYYPVKFDPRASGKAEMHADAEAAKQQLKGAYTSSTTRRSFTKTRVEEVNGRPLLYSLDGIYNGVQEVIHDLTWHEWLIDANKLLKNKAVDQVIRSTYGPDVVRQFKDWVADNAEGGRGAQGAGEMAAAWVRQGVSVSGLGLNVMSAIMQPLGLTQSIVRIGPQWVARGISKAIGSPLETADAINEKSEFMRTRALTRLREIAEIRSQVKGRSKVREGVDASAYFLMMRCQQIVDIPTWWGAYEKAIAEGNDESRAVALSDQAVIDAQGSGGTKDQAAIERGGPTQKLFTVFYSFFNTALNLGVGQTMTSQNKAKLAADYLLLYSVPVILGAALKDALTSGDSGDWDDPEKLIKRLIGEQISFLMGLMVGVREMAGAVQAVTGTSQYGTDYSGPAGTRFLADLVKLGKQINQGEMDDGLRKAIVNTAGELLRLPSAQINRSITGAKALADGKTDNPMALLTGYQEPH